LLLEGGDEDEARILGAQLPVAVGGMAAGVGAAHRETPSGAEEEKQASALRLVLLHHGRNTPQESGVEDAGEGRNIESVFLLRCKESFVRRTLFLYRRVSRPSSIGLFWRGRACGLEFPRTSAFSRQDFLPE